MKFIELTSRTGTKFLYDFDSDWEIHDNGDGPAQWCNYREARNLDAADTYESLKARLQAFIQTPRETPSA